MEFSISPIEKYHFYINLKHRNKRKLQCIHSLKSIGIENPNRFDAIINDIGLIGCTKSHIKCIEIAKSKGWPFVCVFEDDVVFLNPEITIEKINKYINTDYDVLYLGAWIRKDNYKFINEDLIHIKYACCMHAYIVKNHYYDKLLNNLNTSLSKKYVEPNNVLYNNDEYIQYLQKVDNWYCLYPINVTQRDGYSDNFNIERNYSKIITNVPKLLKNNNKNNYKMESITETKVDKVEVSLELIQNLRNIIEVANARIQWKTEELLPVGMIIKQLDDILKKD